MFRLFLSFIVYTSHKIDFFFFFCSRHSLLCIVWKCTHRDRWDVMIESFSDFCLYKSSLISLCLFRFSEKCDDEKHLHPIHISSDGPKNNTFSYCYPHFLLPPKTLRYIYTIFVLLSFFFLRFVISSWIYIYIYICNSLTQSSKTFCHGTFTFLLAF